MLLSKINTKALAPRASVLRDGRPCQISIPTSDAANQSSVMGGMDYHLEIRFDDGESWLARVRRLNATSPPPLLRDYIVESEAATLQFLEKTSVPSPKIFDYASEGSTNPVGVGYILMEKMRGKSLRWGTQSKQQRMRVNSQLVDIYIELAAHPFHQMGSLKGVTDHGQADASTECHATGIGGFARESLSDMSGGELRLTGPLSSLTDYLTKSVQANLDLIQKGEMYGTRNAFSGYLVHLFLFESIPTVVKMS